MMAAAFFLAGLLTGALSFGLLWWNTRLYLRAGLGHGDLDRNLGGAAPPSPRPSPASGRGRSESVVLHPLPLAGEGVGRSETGEGAAVAPQPGLIWPIAAHIARLAGVAGVLIFAALQGAMPLLLCALGVVIARPIVTWLAVRGA